MAVKPRRFDVAAQKRLRASQQQLLVPVSGTDHPLASTTPAALSTSNLSPAKGSHSQHVPVKYVEEEEDVVDPLADPLADPLSQVSTSTADQSPSITTPHSSLLSMAQSARESEVLMGDAPVVWDDRKAEILAMFTTSRDIPIASFIEDAPQSTPVKVANNRLHLLGADESSDVSNRNGGKNEKVTQSEFTKLAEKMRDNLLEAWDREDRVGSLRVVISCCKMLGDNSVPESFYPSLFVLCTEVLDTFSRLVFERIRKRAVDIDPRTGRPLSKLPDDFGPQDVSSDAQEICRNWLYKVASIRELLPRLYVELSLLRLYQFIEDTGTMRNHLARLAKSARGLGNPLVGQYARLYVLRTAVRTVVLQKDGLIRGLVDDVFRCLRSGLDRPVVEFCLSCSQASGVDFQHFLILFERYVLPKVGERVEKKDTAVVDAEDAKWRVDINTMVLEELIKTYPSSAILEHLEPLLVLCRDASCVSHIAAALARDGWDRVDKGLRKRLLREAWKECMAVSAREDKSAYLSAVTRAIAFAARAFSINEVSDMLGDVRESLIANASKYETEISKLISTLLLSYSSKDMSIYIAELLTSQHFLPVLDLLVREARMELFRDILFLLLGTKEKSGTSLSFAPSDQSNLMSDLVLVHVALTMLRQLYDSLDVHAQVDPMRELEQLIVLLIDRVMAAKHARAEKLQVLVDCRSGFPALEGVQVHLIPSALSLFDRNDEDCNRAVAAFCHISIASLSSAAVRVKWYRNAGMLALRMGLVPAVEALFRLAIQSVAELEGEQMEAVKTTLVESLAAALVVVPGHPERGGTYLLKGLVNAVIEETTQVRCLAGLLRCIAAMAQDKLPYHVRGVDSNDALYACDEGYMSELCALGEEVLQRMNTLLGQCKDEKEAQFARAAVSECFA